MPVSIGVTTLAHILNEYEICLNTTSYPIINMQNFIYWLFLYFGLLWSGGIPNVHIHMSLLKLLATITLNKN